MRVCRCHRNGCWCLPYLATLFQTRQLVTRVPAETSSAEFPSFRSIVDKLNGRIDDFEDRSVPQSDGRLNVSEALQRLKESEYEVWSDYNRDGTLLLEDGSKEERQLIDTDAYAREIRSIKSQMEILKQLYSKVKLCCDTRVDDYVRSKDFGERIEAILANNLASSTAKKGAKDGEESRIAADCVLTDDRVREIVKEALKIYDADKTGLVDYALESAGGQIISTRCTQRYDIKTRAFKLLAFTLYHENNNPRTVIQGNPIQPGACWAFQGFPGYLLIKLRSSIYVSGFTIEHAAKSILPNGEMRSAPKKFNVWGFLDENDSDPVMFGDYEFAASDDSLQYFPVQSTTIQAPYEYVELRVHSNHGQLEYTCLYRFRVHGTPL